MTFPAFADWKSPWEEDESEIDPEKVKKLVYNLKKSEDESKDKLKAKDDKIAENETALAAYKKAEADAKKANESETQTLQRELAEAKEALEKGPKESRNELILRVALEKGLTEAQAKRLAGNTLEELQKDADDYLKDIKKPDEGEEEVIEEGGDGLHQQPKVTKVKTPGDPGGSSGGTDMAKHLEARRARNPLIA